MKIKNRILTFSLASVIFGISCLSGCSTSPNSNESAAENQVETAKPSKETEPSDNDKHLSAEPVETEDTQLQKIISEMTLEEKICQLFMVTPEQLTLVDTVIQAGETTKEALARRPVGGLIYFQSNIVDEQQLKTMIANTQSYSKYPLFIGIDEEGGPLVSRIANSGSFHVETFPSMREIGATGDYNKAYQVGLSIGSYLHELGFNMNFAPVADVLTNPSNTVIGSRSFGADPEMNAQMVVQVTKGLQEQGICAVLKHFPGHGGTNEDSHENAVCNDRTLEQLKTTEFLPFSRGIHAGAGCVMVGHISLPSVTQNDLPATLSSEIITGLLRETLSFDGIVITDSMSMGAITNYYTSGEAAIKAIQAGADIILIPQHFEQAFEGLLQAVQSGTITEDRIDESVYRILRYKLFQLPQTSQ